MERITSKVLGYDVDLLSFDNAINLVLEKMHKSEGMQIVTINPEIIEAANKHKALNSIINNAELIIPESSGIELALKLKGIQQERIPGIDFAKELINSCAMFQYPVALIGAKEEVIQTTTRRLKSEFQGLNICYSRNGYFSNNKEDEIIQELANTNPKFVLIALGAPKQEVFITKCRKIMPNTVFIGVGGSFDVWAGVVERAPEFFQVMRAEWLYRTIKQPERIKRIYKTLPMFLFKVIIEAIKENGLFVSKSKEK